HSRTTRSRRARTAKRRNSALKMAGRLFLSTHEFSSQALLCRRPSLRAVVPGRQRRQVDPKGTRLSGTTYPRVADRKPEFVHPRDQPLPICPYTSGLMRIESLEADHRDRWV